MRSNTRTRNCSRRTSRSTGVPTDCTSRGRDPTTRTRDRNARTSHCTRVLADCNGRNTDCNARTSNCNACTSRTTADDCDPTRVPRVSSPFTGATRPSIASARSLAHAPSRIATMPGSPSRWNVGTLGGPSEKPKLKARLPSATAGECGKPSPSFPVGGETTAPQHTYGRPLQTAATVGSRFRTACRST